MKKLNVLAFASAMLAVGAYGDFSPLSETFESATAADEQYATWVGDGYSKTESIASYPAGRPGGITGTSNYVLSVEGSVTNGSLFAGMAASTASQVDMMVKVVWPDEALALPSGETDVQIAVGIDTLGRLNVYCASKSGSGDASFVPVSGELASNEWHRISFNFDYANKLCEIALDGLPQVSEYGALSASATGTAGSWYKLAKNDATVLSSMKIVGTTAIDDVYTSQVTSGNPINIPDSAVVSDSEGTGAAVKKSWLVKQGVADVTAAAPDGTGMTVAQKYVAGLDVNDAVVHVEPA